MPLTPKNWKSFQHYRDRSPGWIKLHRTLLDNVDYYRLSAEAAKALPLLWLLASEKDGIIPDAPEAGFRLRIDEQLAADVIAELVERGFMVEAGHVEQHAPHGAASSQPSAPISRHISDGIKRAVWNRDGGKCCNCGSEENIEYDHRIPISKGGPSDEGNIQLLCRSCNRRKRATEQVERVATASAGLPVGSRSLEKEEENKIEPEAKKDSRAPAAASPPRAPDRFEEFWKAYPRRDGANPRSPAEKKFKALVKSGIDPQIMVAGAAALALAESGKGNIGTKFIPQAMTWLNQQRWSDHAEVAGLLDPKSDQMQTEAAILMWIRMGRWSRFAGPEPGQIGCRATPEMLAKHGLDEFGRKVRMITEPNDIICELTPSAKLEVPA